MLTQSCLRRRSQSCRLPFERPGCGASAPAHTGVFAPDAELLEDVVPHRGQWLQSGSSDILQAGQVLGAVAVMVEGVSGLGGSSSPASATPFLNSFIDFPSEPASSGSFFAPKSTRTITKPTNKSCEPIIAAPPSGNLAPCASARGWSLRCWAHRPRARAHRLDRKSTRLNSSHLVISYAVFCLKKKK